MVFSNCQGTLGDRSRSVGTYREVAIYDPDQVYPEYVVLYERLHRDETPTPPPKGRAISVT